MQPPENSQTEKPRYLQLFQTGALRKRALDAAQHLRACNLCPHQCGTDRTGALGFCRASHHVVLASYGPHFGEERPLVGRHGSGTIFFSYCNMRCVFCQNCEISYGGEGNLATEEKLADIMLRLQDHHGCHNINLVTPTHFVPNILRALVMAVEGGLYLPLVYNCGGYESLSTLRLLEGVIDIYMPDFKYDTSERGLTYSRAKNYPEMAKGALKEMDRQVGGLQLHADGTAYRGLIIRHLMLPGGLEDTRKILKFIHDELSPGCLVNLMDQYYPAHQAHKYRELTRKISSREYRDAYKYADELGLRLAD